MEIQMSTRKWGVIFDVDGTMVDNKDFHQQAWIELCRRYGMDLTIQDYRTHIHARPNEKIIPDIFGPDISKEKAESIALEKETIYRNLYRPQIKPINGLIKLLDELKANCIPCAAASNSPAGNVDLVLDELHIREFFSSVICSDDVKNGKPDPEVFLNAASNLQILPYRCIVFEDSAQGFEAAIRAGMICIAITSGSNKECLAGISEMIPEHKDYTDITIGLLEDVLNFANKKGPATKLRGL